MIIRRHSLLVAGACLAILALAACKKNEAPAPEASDAAAAQAAGAPADNAPGAVLTNDKANQGDPNLPAAKKLDASGTPARQPDVPAPPAGASGGHVTASGGQGAKN